MVNVIKKNLSESIRARLKNLSRSRNRPFDEILRYYAIERFLYRLSISPYSQKFFLKSGLIFKVWDAIGHRATLDIDLLAHTSNKIENLQNIIRSIASLEYERDSMSFDTEKLILRKTQTNGDCEGVSAGFSAKLFTSKIPILIDIGFNDLIIPRPEKIHYPTLLDMEHPELLGYTLETVIGEKLESIVKLALVNTRMKDFYDLWTIVVKEKLHPERLEFAVKQIFSNRKTELKYPVAFTPEFYEEPEVSRRWANFLSSMGKEHVNFKGIILELSSFFSQYMNPSE